MFSPFDCQTHRRGRYGITIVQPFVLDEEKCILRKGIYWYYSVEEEIREEAKLNLATKILDLIKKGIDPAEYLQSIANQGKKAEATQN